VDLGVAVAAVQAAPVARPRTTDFLLKETEIDQHPGAPRRGVFLRRPLKSEINSREASWRNRHAASRGFPTNEDRRRPFVRAVDTNFPPDYNDIVRFS
jgi:hypothetical protein